MLPRRSTVLGLCTKACADMLPTGMGMGADMLPMGPWPSRRVRHVFTTRTVGCCSVLYTVHASQPVELDVWLPVLYTRVASVQCVRTIGALVSSGPDMYSRSIADEIGMLQILEQSWRLAVSGQGARCVAVLLS